MNEISYNLAYPKRKHPRLRYYDYSTPNYYFITICTHKKVCIFGEPGKLNAFGQIAEKGLLEIPKRYENVRLDKYVVMPNHIHAIVVLEQKNKDIEIIMGQYKAFVSKQIRRNSPGLYVWQASFHDHIIRNKKSYEKIWLYIEGNPLKWKEDRFYIE